MKDFFIHFLLSFKIKNFLIAFGEGFYKKDLYKGSSIGFSNQKKRALNLLNLVKISFIFATFSQKIKV